MSEEGKVNVSFEYLFGNLQRTIDGGFSRLDRSVEEIRRELASKASNESVAALKKDLADFELRHETQLRETNDRFKPLETALNTSVGESKWKDRAANVLVLMASSSVGAFLYYIATLGGHG